MVKKIEIRGVLIPNDYKDVYDWFGIEATCPNDVKAVLDTVDNGDEVHVIINSQGGSIDAGSEIYAMLKSVKDIKIFITGAAHSAASVIAMAGYCEMAPTALMMVHCVSTSQVSGNHADMEHMADVLRTADQAICSAYVNKTGMTESEALDMMERETWLTAQQAKDKGLVDKIMFEGEETSMQQLAACTTFLLSAEKIEKARKMINGSNNLETDLLMQEMELLKLKGVHNE